MTNTIKLPREMDEDLWYIVGHALGAASPEQCERAAPLWKKLVARADRDAEREASRKALNPPVDEWKNALEISNLSDIHEAIVNALEDPTEDNIVCLIRDVIRISK